MGRKGDEYRVDLVGFDVETTGLRPGDRVVQIGVVGYKLDGTARWRWERLLNPGTIDWGDPGTAEACRVNGVTPACLVGAPSFCEVAGEVVSLLACAPRVCSHNLTFDLYCLVGELCRGGAQVELPFNSAWCTMILDYGRALERWGEAADSLSYSLAACCARRSIPIRPVLAVGLHDGLHTAAFDADCAAKLWLDIASEREPTREELLRASVAWRQRLERKRAERKRQQTVATT
jgi:DNA polymerase III epsilon subunit-like protein